MKPLGLILPHAKAQFSGHISEAGLSTALGHDYDRVIVLAANHKSEENGFYAGFAEFPHFVEPPGGANLLRDHSIEWLSGLINKYLNVPVVSFIVGKRNREARSAIARYLRPNTLVIASSDLSHYLPAREARRVDGQTINAILHGHQQGIEACGAEAIKLLIDFMDERPTLVAYGNSGQTSKDWSSVVGYAAIRFGKLPSRLEQALSVLYSLLKSGDAPQDGPKQAVFTTITQAGKLQGCTGQIRPQYSLGAAVEHALRSTLEDPRRTSDSLEGAEIKLSLISPLRPTKLDDVRIGPDGLVVEADKGRAALFLPEVPVENHWKHKQYLEELLEKAEVYPSEDYSLFRFTTDCATALI